MGSVPVRVIAAVAALVLLGGLAIVGVLVAARSSSSTATATFGTTTPPPGTETEFPAPPSGSMVFARNDGADALALALRPEGRRLGLQASVVGGEGSGERGDSVTFSVSRRGGTVHVSAVPCGAGCYRAHAPMGSAPRAVTVKVTRGARSTTWRVPIEIWPPRPAAAIVARAERVWRSLRTFEFSEQLSSSPENVVNSHWKIVAPDRLSYVIAGGGAGVIVGNHRWDRQGARWQKRDQSPLDLPQPTWGTDGVTNAHLIGSGTIDGQPAWRVSFFDADGRAWFEVMIAKRTSRTLALTMTATAHFMHQAFSGFNAPLTVRPPAS